VVLVVRPTTLEKGRAGPPPFDQPLSLLLRHYKTIGGESPDVWNDETVGRRGAARVPAADRSRGPRIERRAAVSQNPFARCCPITSARWAFFWEGAARFSPESRE